MDDKKKRSFRKFSFRGVELDKLLDLSQEKVNNYFIAPCRRWLGVLLRGLDGSCAWFGDQGGGGKESARASLCLQRGHRSWFHFMWDFCVFERGLE
jgi:hypothetical protein